MTLEELDEIAAKHGLMQIRKSSKMISYSIQHQIFPKGQDVLIFVDDKVTLLNRLGTLEDGSGYCTLYNDDGELGEILNVSVDKVERFICERKCTFDLMLPKMLKTSIESSKSTLQDLLKLDGTPVE